MCSRSELDICGKYKKQSTNGHDRSLKGFAMTNVKEVEQPENETDRKGNWHEHMERESSEDFSMTTAVRYRALKVKHE